MFPLRSSPADRSVTAPFVWAGRALSAAMAGFLAVEAAARMILARSVVPGTEPSALLAQPETARVVGLVLLIGTGLYLIRRLRGFGTAVLTLALAWLSADLAWAPVASPAHALFWAYVAGLVWLGHGLRRAGSHRRLVPLNT